MFSVQSTIFSIGSRSPAWLNVAASAPSAYGHGVAGPRRRFFWPIKAEEKSHGPSQYDDASRERAAWNAGKKVGTKRPLTQKQIWAVRFFLDRERRVRDAEKRSAAVSPTRD
jgi:hypothetical protein